MTLSNSFLQGCKQYFGGSLQLEVTLSQEGPEGRAPADPNRDPSLPEELSVRARSPGGSGCPTHSHRLSYPTSATTPFANLSRTKCLPVTMPAAAARHFFLEFPLWSLTLSPVFLQVKQMISVASCFPCEMKHIYFTNKPQTRKNELGVCIRWQSKDFSNWDFFNWTLVVSNVGIRS